MQSLDVEKDLFHPKDDGEAIFSPEVPYLSTIGAFMYFQIILDLILYFQLIYWEDIVLHQLIGIGMM